MTYNDRGPDRRATSIFRTSVEEKAALEREAAAADLTLQQLFELKVLGAVKSGVRPGRRRKHPEQEGLYDISA